MLWALGATTCCKVNIGMLITTAIMGQICNRNWSRCSHPAESVQFCIVGYFYMLSSKIGGSKKSDQWTGRHLEFQYGHHDEILNITILGSK